MNKEMMYLDENTVLVTDEKGNISKKTYETNMKQILESENKLENIEKIIGKLKKEIENYDNINDLCEFTLKMLIPALLVSVPTFLLGITTSAIVAIVIACAGICSISTAIIKKISSKKNNGFKAQLKTASNYEEEYKKELADLLIKKDPISEVSKDKIFNNDIMPLKYSEILDNSVYDEMNMVYNDAYDKPITLTKKKK